MTPSFNSADVVDPNEGFVGTLDPKVPIDEDDDDQIDQSESGWSSLGPLTVPANMVNWQILRGEIN